MGIPIAVNETCALNTRSASSTHEHIISTTCLQCHYTKGIPCPPLPSENPVSAETGDPLALPHETEPSNSQTLEHAQMLAPADNSKRPLLPGRKRRRKNAKLPPLSLREDAGHLIFVGNQEIERQ